MSTSNNPVDTLARTAWGEARGTGATGMQAIMNVVLNRADHQRWWGDSIVSVCLEPYQFSCYNHGDPNQQKVLAVTQADPQFALALTLAARAVAGVLPDLTHGADSYYAKSMPYPPSWAARAIPSYQDNWHAFFRIELPAPGTITPQKPHGEPVAPCLSCDDLNDRELQKISP